MITAEAAIPPCELGHLPTKNRWSFYSQGFSPEKRPFRCSKTGQIGQLCQTTTCELPWVPTAVSPWGGLSQILFSSNQARFGRSPEIDGR